MYRQAESSLEGKYLMELLGKSNSIKYLHVNVRTDYSN